MENSIFDVRNRLIKNRIKVVPWKFFFVTEKKFSQKKTTFEILWYEVWKGGFQLMLILGLLGMYRGFLPYATFGTSEKVALAKNRISKIFILCTQ